MECKAQGCGNKIFSNLLCRNHYERERLETAAPCSFSGCGKKAYRGLLCITHYRIHNLSNRPLCTVPNCNNPQKTLSSGYCGKHESRIRAHASVDALRPNDWGAREKHPLYKLWVWHKRAKNGMCDAWRTDFWAFVSTVGDRPEGNTLRRLDATKPLGEHNWYWKEPIEAKDAAEYQREWRNNNPEKAKNSDLKKMYGITLQEYEALLEQQKDVCAICKGKETTKSRDGVPRRMPVDHCHVTGRIRGLLCTQCNRGLGMFGDNSDRLIAAAQYLAKYA
jgi:hypothetical protein